MAQSARDKTGRARGRPRGRPAATPGNVVGADSILQATCKLLGTRAPHDITVELVASTTHVDRSLIRYYFRSRANLMLSVARYLYAQLKTELITSLSAAERTPESRIRATARAVLRFQVRYPYFHRLLIDEVATSRLPDAVSFMRTMTSDGLAHFRTLAEAAARRRTVEPFESAFLYLAIIGMSELGATGSPFLKVAFGDKYEAADVNARYEQFVMRFVVDGLRRRRKR